MNDISSFGRWVQQERKTLGLTQRQLAAQIGCSTVTIKKIEQETRRPSHEMAILLAETLQISPTLREQFITLARGERAPQTPKATLSADHISPIPMPLVRRPPFIGRKHEIALLDERLQRALDGHGQIAFITGEAGRGKTSLLMAFARRAQQRCADLIVAGGSCNSFVGPGDPFLPFRDVMATLTGEVDPRWRTTMHERQISQIWRLLPMVVQNLVAYAPNVIQTLVTGESLVQRMAAHFATDARWQQQLQQIVKRQTGLEQPHQQQIFDQTLRFLTWFARQTPLVLLFDDLQWADHASLNLLFHVGQRLAGSPILILGAFRASEAVPQDTVASELIPEGRTGHLLSKVVNELQRNFGNVVIDLEQTSPTESRAFVDGLIDSDPNRLSFHFREEVYQRTQGYPLFAIELLRAMQERGDLIQDENGQWIEGTKLNWDQLPMRVEAAIRQRIERLPHQCRHILRIAAVEGEVFTTEVIAALLNVAVQEVIPVLSEQLGRQAQLLIGQGSRRVGGRLLSQYRFGHALIQVYLYQQLDRVERMTLHEAVGTLLESFFHDAQVDIAPQLARHFEEAQILEKAILYLLLAGKRAVGLSAYTEAIAHLTKGLTLLHTLPPTATRDQQELEFLTALGVPLLATKHYGAIEVEQLYTKAHTLCLKITQRPQPMILRALALAALARGNHVQAHTWAGALLQLVQSKSDAMLLMEAHYSLGVTHFWLSNFVDSHRHLQDALTLYQPEQQRTHIALFAQDPKAVSLQRLAYTCWYLGYPTQALTMVKEALDYAETLDHPFTLAYVLNFSAWLLIDANCLDDATLILARAIDHAIEYHFPHWMKMAKIFQHWLAVETTRDDQRVASMIEAIHDYRCAESQVGLPFFQSLLARAYAKIGNAPRSVAVIDEALQEAEQHGDHWYDAELYRLRGELLLTYTPCAAAQQHAAAETSLQRALTIAQRQHNRLHELRTAMSLCRLWRQQGKQQAAFELLSSVYGWFTEGFDTLDLLDAKALLDELAS